ncbi:cinnamyl alcohol dehydrogenase [Salix suchowensis]|nr:cinnamyl alcohol dehydrogenase [Salix suchowensis]
MIKFEDRRPAKKNSISCALYSRHLNGLKVASSSRNMEYSSTWLVPRGIRQSGPSKGGPGHRSGNAQLLGSTQHSGPSPGVGHKYSAGMH